MTDVENIAVEDLNVRDFELGNAVDDDTAALSVDDPEQRLQQRTFASARPSDNADLPNVKEAGQKGQNARKIESVA